MSARRPDIVVLGDNGVEDTAGGTSSQVAVRIFPIGPKWLSHPGAELGSNNRIVLEIAVLSRSQIDRLGSDLRAGAINDQNLRKLDIYRRSFEPAYVAASTRLKTMLTGTTRFGRTEVSGRVGKSTLAIVAKLRRQTTKLSQMQDIAGLRVITASVRRQNEVVSGLLEEFPAARLFDRRTVSSHGYRAVHLVCPVNKHFVEVQVRTMLQDLWAQLSEKLGDQLGYPGIKYGEYPAEYPQAGHILIGVSDSIADLENKHLGAIRASEGEGAVPKLIQRKYGRLIQSLQQAMAILAD